MPIVNIPEVGRVRFPDDMAEADISREANGLYLQRQQESARAAGEQPTSSKSLDALSRLPEGMATGTARTLQGAARVADIAGDTPPIPFMGGIGMDRAARVQADINRQITAANLQRAATRQQRVEESPLYQFGAQTTEAAQDFYGVDRRRDDEFVAQLATAAGEMVPTLTAGAVAGPLGAGAQYALNAGESQAQEAIAAGKPESADIAFLSAAGLGGITEAALGVPGRLLTIANRARKAGVNPGTFGRWANRNPIAAGIARAGAEGALREGAQEGLEQAGQNLIASDVAGYDPDRPVGQGVGRAAALGATLGGVIGGGAAGVNQANRNQLAADLRAARGQRIVGYTSEGQPIPAADAVPDPLADLRGMANPTADAPATPGTTVLPDGRVVLVNQQTGTTDFPPQAESQPLKVESPEAAPLSTFNLQPSTPLSPATPPTGAVPAPTAEVAPPVLSPAASSTFNLQPSTRGEAAMETRRAAPLDLQREPAVSPELADAIAAVRAGYNPEVEAPVSPTPTPTLNPNPALPIEESLSAAVMPVPLERQAEFAAAAARAPWATDLKRRPTGWKIIEFREGATLVSLDGKQMVRFEAADKSSGTEALRKKMEAQAWAMDNPLSLGDSGPAPQTPSPTPPDQSGGPTELTPPAKLPAQPPASWTGDARKAYLTAVRELPIVRAAGAAQLRKATSAGRNKIEKSAFKLREAADVIGLEVAPRTGVLDIKTELALADAIESQLTQLVAEIGGPAAQAKPVQSGGPTELTPPAKAGKLSSRRGAAAGGTGTITGSNERRGSEMPAEAGSTPVPTEGAAPRRTKQEEVAARKTVKAAAQEFDRLVLEWGAQLGWVKRPELMAQRFAREGLDTVSIKAKILQGEELKSARTRAASTFARLTGLDMSDPADRAKLLPQLKEYLAPRMAEREQSQQFDQKVIQGQRPAGEEDSVQVLSADSLRPGDTFTVQGHGFTVEQVFTGEDGRITGVKVQDGPKFGVQTVGAEDYLYIDFDSLERGEPPVANDFALNAPESVQQRQLTKAEAREYSDLEDKRRAAQEGGPALTQREAKRYAELTAIAGQQELMAEDASSGKAGRLATLQAKRAELDRLQRLALDRGNAAPYGSNAKEMAYADAASYAKESARIREEIAALNEPAAQEGELFTASAAYPGGNLGSSPAPQPPPPTGSIPPAQDREHSVFPLELPELVRLARMLGQGHFPKLKNALRGGKALGVFRYRKGDPDSGRIELVRGLWQMVLPEEKAELQRKAEAYAAAMVDQTDAAERARVAKAKYEADLETLMDERLKQDPIMAVKVLAHEIGHWIDFLPQAMISGRGNLFGHVASLKKFLRHTITWDPKFAELNETGELTDADRRRLREAARRELEKELGPIREIIEKVLIEEPVFATTGVTPEDVKRLFGMNARETMPELYLWFAGLNAATKKEVVKAAMRGMVDARVPASRVQTGTRTVEREVRKVSGRMPTPEEIAARFQAKLREAMEARRTMDINEVKAQLREAITWWRGAKQFEEYFASPEEMYAEAFSIFLANPAALAQRAPKYFNALLNYMDRKPEAAKAYGDLQLAIRQGTLQQQRDKDLLAGFAKDEQRFRDRADLRKPPMDWVDNLVYHMDRRLGPIYRRARGSKLEGTIRGALGDFNYRGAEHERFLSAINREVSKPLVAANLEWSDLGYYMFHKRVVEHFDQKAVPLGYSPHSSQKALDAKQAELGPARWAALEQAQRQFMALYQSQVVPLLKTSGLTTPELQKLIEDRVFYATFKAVKDDPKDDIERLLTQAYGSGVGSHIYRRVGNLGEVANPATATLMKALSLMSAAYRNNAKRHLPAMLEEMGLPVREVEKTWDKNLNALTYDTTPLGAASPVQKLVFMEDGKPKAYYVEASIAEAFNSGDPIENNLLLGVLAASRGMKRLFTDINYGFWPFAFVRDVAGFGMQMPGLLAPVRYFKNLPKAFAASRDSLKGKPNPLADEALKRKMWISQADPYGVRDAAENEAELQIAAHGLTPASWERGGYRAKFAAAWEWYRNWGKVLERTHKLNGMLYLDQHYADLPEWQKQEMVREWAGSPDFLQQPGDRRWINALALFYNPWKESLRSVAKAAKHHPGEFAAKATLGILMPTVLQSLAVMGLLGDDLEEMYKSVGDYDLTNYLIFPLGWEDKAQGKVKYLRFPLWEPARMAHGLLFGQITGRGEKPLSHAGGQVPGLNPLLTATAAWMDYKLRGRNPYDSHYGREILDPDVFKVGGTAADAAMLKWTWNQLGGSVLFRFDTRPELIKNDTPLEKSLKAPGVSNLVGRFLRVSNRGILDADRKVIEPGEQQRARVRLAVDEVKAKLLRNEALAQSEHLLLSVDPYARDYLLRTLPEDYLKRQSLLYQRLQRAPNNEAKVKLLTETRGGGWVSD